MTPRLKCRFPAMSSKVPPVTWALPTCLTSLPDSLVCIRTGFIQTLRETGTANNTLTLHVIPLAPNQLGALAACLGRALIFWNH